MQCCYLVLISTIFSAVWVLAFSDCRLQRCRWQHGSIFIHL